MNLKRIIPLFSVILFAIFCGTSGQIFCASCDTPCPPGHKRAHDGVCREVWESAKREAFYRRPCINGYVRINLRCRKIRHKNKQFPQGLYY